MGGISQAQTSEVVRAYHDAYRRGDVAAAGAQLADSFTFSSPMMAFDSAQQHVASLVRFVPLITGVDLISELYGEGEATLVYDLHTSLPGGAATQRSAEYFRLTDGRISSIILVFDATPWRPIIQAAADIRGPLEGADRNRG